MSAISTLFVITVATARMFFPNIPALTEDTDPQSVHPFLIANKSVNFDLTSSKAASSKSKVECAVPEGLKVGKSVTFVIETAEPAKEEPSAEPTDAAAIKAKSYWGSGTTIPEGQPAIVDPTKPAPAMAQLWPSVEKEATYAYWAGPNNRGLTSQIGDAPGAYTLTTDYCGSTTVTLDAEQNFLAPIELTSPTETVKFENPIKLEWKPVPNAIAYYASAFGGSDKESILWTSSSKPDQMPDLEYRALSKEKIAELIKDGVLLAPNTTTCIIPAGIFNGSDGAMANIVAIGVDKIQEKDDIRTEVVVRSTVGVPLMEKNALE